MELQTHGAWKYRASVLLTSSAGLGWSTISAELRSHWPCELLQGVPESVELCVMVDGNDDALVRRRGDGQCLETVPRTGAIWLHPIGAEHSEVTLSAPVPKTMHLYLPSMLFRRLGDDFSLSGEPARSIRYTAGFQDEMINQLARSVLSEMTSETAVSRMYVEAASLALGARIIQGYSDAGVPRAITEVSRRPDYMRMRRVLDYISARVTDELTLTKLAEVAGLSTFHFARMFKLVVGVSPQRYVSGVRLQQAMAELAAGKLPLAQIALNARFSSQASFTRAFSRTTGMTPAEYRRCRR
jgi:AraC family transcriptional regulator